MALRKARNTSLKTLTLLFCFLQFEVVISNLCTAGADYMYCHEIRPYGPDVDQLSKTVYTVHECREFCDEIGCFAFKYQACAARKLQFCWIFNGTNESVEMFPDYSQCDDKTWFYSWRRPIENSIGDCTISGERTEQPLVPPFPGPTQIMLTTTASPKSVGSTAAANTEKEGLTTSANPESVALPNPKMQQLSNTFASQE